VEGGAEEQRLSEIGIVGAGIAGTTLAIACRRAGLDVRLYEQHQSPHPDPVLLSLTPNGTRVLLALGLKEPLGAIALAPMFGVVRSSRTGFMLSQRPLGGFSEARYGAPFCVVGTGDLNATLRDAAVSLGVPIERGCRVENVETTSATLVLADGSRVRHAALAVATGIPAKTDEPELSALLESRSWRVPDALTVIRARIRRDAPDRDHARFVNTWIGPELSVIEHPAPVARGAGQEVELTMVITAPRPDRAAAAVLADRLAKCHPHLVALATAAEAEYVDQPLAGPATAWQSGRTALLGDAAHGGALYPELNPSPVLEDAWILSRMMERSEEAPYEEFPAYERFRRPRAERLKAFAASELESHTLVPPGAVWRRNFAWSMTSRFLPEIALQRLDWLYGYDCIRGFA
jgi:salicylate hydroxylase